MDVSVFLLALYEKLEVPQIQLIVGVLDIPVVAQRQVPTAFQVQFLEVVDMSVVVQRQARAAKVCRQGLHPCRGAEADLYGSVCPQTIEISQLQSIDKVVFVLVVQVVQVSPVPAVEKTGGSHSAAR